MSEIKTFFILIGKIFLFLILFLALMLVQSVLLEVLARLLPSIRHSEIPSQLIMLSSVLLSAWIVVHFWDKQPFSSLGFSVAGRGWEMLWGIFMAVIIYVIGFNVMAAVGWIEIVSFQPSLSHLLSSFILMVLIAVSEEVMLRGFVLGHMIDVGMNRFFALFLSSLLFSLLHVFNPDFSWISFLNILLAGFLLGGSYIYTRNLWCPIMLHLFWNWIQGPVLGFPVSGMYVSNAALTLNISDDVLFNGGRFGFEASLVCMVLMLLFIPINIYVSKHFVDRELKS